MKKNGYFQIINQENETAIKVFPAEGGGEEVTFDQIRNYLDDNCVKEYDLSDVLRQLGKASSAFMVTVSKNKTWPIMETMELMFDKTRRVAAVRFFPPSSDGKFMTKGDIMDELRRKGIVHGILENNIELYMNDRQYNTNVLVAKATMPIEGKDALIEYFFKQHNTSKPKLNEDGTVDFHRLDNMSRVRVGDILAKLTPEVQGKAGMDIMGNRLMPKKVKILRLKKTNQTELSEDGLTLFSKVSGHVTLIEGKVFVSDTYEVAADVDASTGDIDYDGNVLVKGNVRTGYSVRSRGNIIVEGVVEGAELFADGDIILKRGVQGMNRGKLEAKGNVVTKFIENSVVKSGMSIQTEAILHSRIEAKDEILVVGKKGLVTGGELKAGSCIHLKVAGSTMGSATVLEVGIDPEISDKYITIEKKINDLNQEKSKLQQVYDLLKAKLVQGTRLPADKIALLKMIPAKLESLDKEITEKSEDYFQFKDQLEEMNNGCIIVDNMAYPGVKIIISSIIKYIRTEEHHSKYKKEDGEVKTTFL